MDSGSKDKLLTYWLIPAEPAWSWLRSLIDDCARRLDAPIFEPHVTLYVTEAAQENTAEVLEKAVGNLEPLCLSISGLDCSDEFTKTLFVQFQPEAALLELSEKLRAASVSRREYKLNPHLSLVYKHMQPEAKNEWMNSIKLPFTEVEFDSVKAVISPAKVETREDVESWRAVATRSLRK
jgi:2'-5' RNA ligase